MIYVCALSQLEQSIIDLEPSHLITLLAPDEMIDTPTALGDGRHLRLGLNDIAELQEGLVAPEQAHIEEILAFVDEWDRSAPMLVHCWAGISRSTATAYIALCHLNEGREAEAAQLMRAQAEHAQPNRRLVALADALMGREGRMIAAVETMGPGVFDLEGSRFSVSATL